MNWLNPVAFAGLALIAVPIIVHLFARRNARVLKFPTLRFIDDARAVSPRAARLTDVPLLLLRIAIVGLAVAALAQPYWMSDARRAEMQRQVARVVIVDTSASVARTTPAGEGGVVVARREAAVFADEVGAALVVETSRPYAELAGAAEWLAASRVANREIVVVSDFQRGAIAAGDLASIPADVGVRLVRVEVTGEVSVGGGAGPAVSVVVTDADRRAAEATVEVASRRAGAADTGRRIVVDFTTAVHDAAPDAPWMGDVAWALRGDSVRVGTRDGALVVVPVAAPGTLAAALTVKRAFDAIAATPVGERESVVVADSALRAWERTAVGDGALAAGGGSDGRWLWVVVLLLLVAEHVARRPERRTTDHTEVHG